MRFVCLNTNALEYDYSHPVPDFNFMEDELRNMPVGVEKTIVAMHVPPGDGEFNNNVGRAFEHYIASFPMCSFVCSATSTVGQKRSFLMTESYITDVRQSGSEGITSLP